MLRRDVLAVLSSVLLLSGCNSGSSDGTTNEATTTDGETTLLADRDPPPAEGLPTTVRPAAGEPPNPSGDTVAPTGYPERPESYTDESVGGFVEGYERAYRRNGLLAEYGGSLIDQGTAVDWVRTLDATTTAGVGRLQYRYSATIDEGEEIVVSDSPTVVATYYVDDSVVVRAAATGRRERRDVLDPDPWETGEVLSAQ